MYPHIVDMCPMGHLQWMRPHPHGFTLCRRVLRMLRAALAPPVAAANGLQLADLAAVLAEYWFAGSGPGVCWGKVGLVEGWGLGGWVSAGTLVDALVLLLCWRSRGEQGCQQQMAAVQAVLNKV
jgi:hypothetical protein